MTNHNNSMPNPFPGLTINNNFYNTQASNNKKIKISKGVRAGNDGVLIHVILDESSSMNSCWDSTIDAFNEWLDSQKHEDGKCNLTICKFNGTSVQYVTENTPINNVEPLSRKTYRPNGMTNLLDAIGDNLTRIDSHLKTHSKNKRPGVMTIVMTDGLENASSQFTKSMISKMVDSREKKDWIFTFLGANIDAFSEGSAMGFKAGTTLQYSTDSMGNTMKVMAGKTSMVRSAYASGMSGDELMASASYNDSERVQAMSKDDSNGGV